jgi:hypothetical protein
MDGRSLANYGMKGPHMNPASTAAPKDEKSAFPKEIIRQAIAEGKALIKDGKTKVEATTAMYAMLKAADSPSHYPARTNIEHPMEYQAQNRKFI